MKLDRHDLEQLDEAALRRLPKAALSVTLLADLKDVYERLYQTPANSPRPPSSRAPWERNLLAGASAASEATAATQGNDPPTGKPVPAGAAAPSADANKEAAPKQRQPGKSRSAPPVTFTARLLSRLRIDTPVTVRAARLDTGLVASDYPGGISTH